MRARSVASNLVGVADQGLLRPPPQMRGLGRSATERTITSACSGETVPATIRARVRPRAPVNAVARRTSRLPSPRRRPPRWVSQSPVDP